MVKRHIYFKIRRTTESLTPFKDLRECEYCKFACKITTNRAFLFNFEVKKYPKDKIVRIGDNYFIKFSDKKPIYCSYLSIDKRGRKRCSIQQEKPLFCVLDPITVHGIESVPFWIFDGECPLSSKKENIENAKEFVSKLEKNIDNSILSELIRIASIIEKNFPFEKKHIVPLKKIELKKK